MLKDEKILILFFLIKWKNSWYYEMKWFMYKKVDKYEVLLVLFWVILFLEYYCNVFLWWLFLLISVVKFKVNNWFLEYINIYDIWGLL